MSRLKSILISIVYPYACKDCGKRIRLFSDDSDSWSFFRVCGACWVKMLRSCDVKIHQEEQDRVVAQIKRALREHESEKGGGA